MKFLVWGFDNSIGERLVHHFKMDGNEVVGWVSEHPDAENIHKFFDPEMISLKHQSGDAIEFEYIRRHLLGHKLLVMELITRSFPDFTLDFHELANAVEIYFRAMYEKLVVLNPDVIVFGNLPHEGADFCVYQIARQLGITTILFTQTRIKNRTFLVNTLEQMGDLLSIKPVSPWERFEIKRGLDEVHFDVPLGIYTMEKDRIDPSGGRKIRRWSKTWEVLTTGSLDSCRQLNFRERRWNRFKENTDSTEVLTIELEKFIKQPFVYFPLALQPELSTSVLGGLYSDQITAIEALSRILPEGWRILVKENPKQNEFQRGDLFFHRLRMCKNVVLVPHTTSTYDLTKRARIVALISGTAGWEALRHGVPALVFGHPWYKSLHGVTEFKPGISLLDVAAKVINHEELTISLAELLSRSISAVTDGAFKSMFETFDEGLNALNIKNAIYTNIKELTHA